jgi:hypothetical protein
MVETLDFALEEFEVFGHEFFEDVAFLFVGVDVFVGDALCFFDRVAGVQFFGLQVVLDAAFGLADGAGAGAGDAAADLDGA